MKLNKFVFGVVLILFFVANVDAAGSKFIPDFIEDNWEGVVEKSKLVFGFEKPSEVDTIYGIQIPGFRLWVRYFSIGFLAGFYLWAISTCSSILETIRRRVTGRGLEGNPFSKLNWLEMVAGNLWKVFLIAVMYAVLIQIPLINRFVQIITLDFLSQSFWFKTIIIALEIGFIPIFLEWAWKERMHYRFEKAKEKQEKFQVKSGV